MGPIGCAVDGGVGDDRGEVVGGVGLAVVGELSK